MVTKVLAHRAHDAENRRDGDVFFVRAKTAELTTGSRNIWYFHPDDTLTERVGVHPMTRDWLICTDGVLRVGKMRDGHWVDSLYSYFRKATLPAEHEPLLAGAQVWFGAYATHVLPRTIWLSDEFPAYCINNRKRRLFLTRATPKQLLGKAIHFVSEPMQSPIEMKAGDMLLTLKGEVLAVRGDDTLGPDRYEHGTFTFPRAATLA